MGRPGPLTAQHPAAPVTLRRARRDDAARLLEWRNDADAVRFSGTGRAVGAAEHAAWLDARLDDPATLLWIAEVEGAPVGMVRLDVEDATGTVSLTVAPAHRGRGFATQMLRCVLAEVAGGSRVTRLRARTHTANVASRRAFERTGFEAQEGGADGFVTMERPAG